MFIFFLRDDEHKYFMYLNIFVGTKLNIGFDAIFLIIK